MRSMLALVALALAPTVSAQTTWYVDINGTPPGSGTVTDPYTSINYAVSQASTISGDLVLVSPGTYQEQVVLLAKGVYVKSTGGPSATIIDAGGGGSAVAILGTGSSKASIEGFTLTKGSGTGTAGSQGGGVYASASLVTIVDCIIENNTANVGGGLFLRNCMTNVAQCVVRQNATVFGGAGSRHGGGIYVGGGSLDLTDCLVEYNVAGTSNSPGNGGGIYAASGLLHATQTVVRGNVGDFGGGGLFVTQGSIEGCQIENNRGQYGGGVLGGAGLLISDSLLKGNIAISASGAGHYGGGVYGPVTLIGCTLANNQAFGTGGGAHSAILIDCVLDGNWASIGSRTTGLAVGGGAIHCTLTNCVLSRNISVGDGSTFMSQGAGALYSTLVGCTVYRNAALGAMATGGGLGHCTTSFTSVYDNYSASFGGGVLGGKTTNCTVVGNRAAIGAGGVLDSGQAGVLVRNSIIWNNGQEIRLAPNSTASVTYCDVKGGFPGTGNINLDPQFWNEAAQDFHLLATSPCIDAGDPLSPPDPDGSQADMGAFPYDPSYTGG
jgi:hypothetical protein